MFTVFGVAGGAAGGRCLLASVVDRSARRRGSPAVGVAWLTCSGCGAASLSHQGVPTLLRGRGVCVCASQSFAHSLVSGARTHSAPRPTPQSSIDRIRLCVIQRKIGNRFLVTGVSDQ